MLSRYKMRILLSRFRVLACFFCLLGINPNTVAEVPDSFFQGSEREEALLETKRLAEILDRNHQKIMDLRGVLGMGIGLDEEQAQLVLLVLVDKDMALPDLPQSIENVPVRTKRTTKPEVQHGGGSCSTNSPCHANQLPLPVNMGNSAYSAAAIPNCDAACTMGFKACDVVNKEIVYVTNAHCSTDTTLIAGSAPIGSDTTHVAGGDSQSCSGAGSMIIGQTAAHATPSCTASSNTVDVAVINSSGLQTNISIRDIGTPSVSAGTALPGDIVQKSGRSTGYTMGVVTATNVTISIGYVGCIAPFDDQILVLALNPPYSSGGDSGSAVLNMQGEIVGLHFAGSTGALAGVFGYANPIAEVLSALQLSLDFDDCVSCVYTEAANQTEDPRGFVWAARQFRDEYLRRHELGDRYIDLYYRHTDAAVQLMKKNPALIGEAAKAITDNAHILRSLTSNGHATMGGESIDRLARLFDEFATVADAVNNDELQEVFLQLKAEVRDPDILAQFGIQIVPTVP